MPILPTFTFEPWITVKVVGALTILARRMPNSAPSAMFTGPETSSLVLVPAAGSAENSRWLLEPMVRLFTRRVSVLTMPRLPLMTEMSRPPAFVRLPSTVAPPSIDSRSWPAPNEIEPSSVPLQTFSVSLPFPNRTSPTMLGAAVVAVLVVVLVVSVLG